MSYVVKRIAAVTFLLLISEVCLNAHGVVPFFIQVDHYYIAKDAGREAFRVIQIGSEGWIEVEHDGKIFWLNTNVLPAIMELDSEEQINLMKLRKTAEDMRKISQALGGYKIDRDQYPSGRSIADLSLALEHEYIEKLPVKDAWGNELSYYVDSNLEHYWLISYGAEGKKDADIYLSDGRPLEKAFKKTTDLKDDQILSDGNFVRADDRIYE